MQVGNRRVFLRSEDFIIQRGMGVIWGLFQQALKLLCQVGLIFNISQNK